MFLLPRDQLPASAKGLEQAMEEALQRFCARSEPMVEIAGAELRNLDGITVNLSGATLDSQYRPPASAPSERRLAVFARSFTISGEPITILGSQLKMRLSASSVYLDQATTPEGVFLLLRQAESGDIRVTVRRADLEELIARSAAMAAEKHGVSIDDVSLELTLHSPRTAEVRVTVKARKLLFRVGLHVSGSLVVSDDFVARLLNLRCGGDGTIAALACAAITPQLRKIENRAFSLSTLPIGQVRLDDVALDADEEQIVLTARFGSHA